MSDAKVRYFDFTPVDYLEGISDLDDSAQVAVYTVAFVTMQARGGPILDDAAWLGRVAHIRTEPQSRAALDALIAKGKLFVTDGGKLFNRRVETDLKRSVERIEQARINGRQGGRPPKRAPLETKSRRGRDVVETSSRSTDNEQNQPVRKPNGSDSPISNPQSVSKTPTTDLTTTAGKPESVRAATARLIPDDWQPSGELLARIRKGRPDLVGKFYDERLQDFREWCAAKAVTTHHVESTFSTFMRNSKAAPKQSETDAREKIKAAKDKWGIT